MLVSRRHFLLRDAQTLSQKHQKPNVDLKTRKISKPAVDQSFSKHLRGGVMQENDFRLANPPIQINRAQPEIQKRSTGIDSHHRLVHSLKATSARNLMYVRGLTNKKDQLVPAPSKLKEINRAICTIMTENTTHETSI